MKIFLRFGILPIRLDPSLVLLLIFVLFSLKIGGQDFFNHYSIKDGLSQQDINSIYQDKYGFYWVGTNDGLNRFDGRFFERYELGDGTNDANSNLIGDICGDQQGHLWIATHGDGIKHFNQETGHVSHFRNEKDSTGTISSNRVHSILVDSQNRLWVFGAAGIDVADLKDKESGLMFRNLSMVNKFLDASVSARFKENSGGNVFFYERNVLLEISLDEKFIPEIIDHSEHFGTITDILEIKKGVCLLASESGLFTYDLRDSVLKISSINSEAHFKKIGFYTDSTRIWALTDSYLMRYDKTDGENSVFPFCRTKEIALQNGLYKSFIIDKQGVIWLASNKDGLGHFNPNDIIFSHLHVNNSSLKFICQDNFNYSWLGTNSQGLYRIHSSELTNLSKISFKKSLIPAADINVIREVEIDNSREIWVGTRLNGVFRFQLENDGQIRGKPINYRFHENDPQSLSNNYICDILQDSGGTIWVATYLGGINKVDINSDIDRVSFSPFGQKELLNDELNFKTVRCLFEDTQNRLFLGTPYGLAIKMPRKDGFTPISFSGEDEMPRNLYIQSIFQSSDGSIWLGTIGDGLIKAQNGDFEKISHYTVENGMFPNNTVKSIIEDDYGQLWMGTNIGLVRFNISDESFELFDKANGLMTYEYEDLSAFKLDNNCLLFGSNKGADLFFPKKDSVSIQNELRVVVTKFSVFNEPLSPGKPIEGVKMLKKTIPFTDEIFLGPYANSFTAEFSALNTNDYKNVVFSYKLIGFDDDWSITSRLRKATYTNIPPGDYVFKVTAMEGSGKSNASAQNISIHIATPFYKSGYAVVFYFLLFLLFIYFFQKYTIIRHNEKNKLVFENFRHEKTEELNELKMQFFTSISHQFKTPLFLIYAPVEALMKNDGMEHEKAMGYLNVISKNTKYLLRLINQLLEFNKLEQNKTSLRVENFDCIAFLSGIVEAFQGMASDKNIDLVLRASVTKFTVWLDVEKFEMIIYNLISNSLKYTNPGGSVLINFHNNEDEYFKVTVEDSGIGISEESQNHIFEKFYQGHKSHHAFQGTGIGLYFTKKLVELHQGKMHCKSEKDKGTTMVLEFKKGKEHFSSDQLLLSEKDVMITAPLVKPDLIFFSKTVSHKREKESVSIVLAEDDSDLRSFLVNELGQDYSVYDAPDGRSALSLITEHKPELVILDVMIPEINGFNLCTIIRKNLAICHIPIIFISASNDDSSKIEGLKCGADDYISKPFSLEYLKLKISRLVENKHHFRETVSRGVHEDFWHKKLSSMDEKLFEEIKSLIEENIMNSELSVNWLADNLKMSRSLLFTKMKAIADLSPNEFIRNYRLSKAKELFDANDHQVKEVMYKVGFNSSSYFSKCFKKVYGCLPGEYIKRSSRI